MLNLNSDKNPNEGCEAYEDCLSSLMAARAVARTRGLGEIERCISRLQDIIGSPEFRKVLK